MALVLKKETRRVMAMTIKIEEAKLTPEFFSWTDMFALEVFAKIWA